MSNSRRDHYIAAKRAELLAEAEADSLRERLQEARYRKRAAREEKRAVEDAMVREILEESSYGGIKTSLVTCSDAPTYFLVGGPPEEEREWKNASIEFHAALKTLIEKKRNLLNYYAKNPSMLNRENGRVKVSLSAKTIESLLYE